MSFGFGPAADLEMISLIRTAVDRGVTFFDAAQFMARTRTAACGSSR